MVNVADPCTAAVSANAETTVGKGAGAAAAAGEDFTDPKSATGAWGISASRGWCHVTSRE